MRKSEEISEESSKIINKLFIYADSRDADLNVGRSLIVNPEMLRILFQQLSKTPTSYKLMMMEKVSTTFALNSLNPSILLNRDQQIMQFNYSIFDELLTFSLSLKLKLSDNQMLLNLLKPFLAAYPITCRNIRNITHKIATDFYYEKFNHQKLQLALKILQQLYTNQVTNPYEPSSYFFMYAQNSGVRLLHQNLKWTLFKGFYFYICFYVEGHQHDDMNLLHIYVNDDVFQVCISQDNELEVKVLSVTKRFRLRKLQSRKWYFMKMAYCLRTGIIRNTFELVAHLEGEPYEIRDLPVPSPSMNHSIEELGIGRDFYGKINIALISRNEIHHWQKNGINSWADLDKLFSANGDKVRQIFLLYSPLIITEYKEKKIVYEITSEYHGEILENTGIYNNPFDSVDINYYGGIYTILPFFYILKFYKHEQYPDALEDILMVSVQIFESNFGNIEQEAINCQFFSIVGQFINQIEQKYITEHCIIILASFRDIIVKPALQEDFFINLLWKIRTDRLSNLNIVKKLFRLLLKYYYKDYQWCLKLKPLQDIIWYIVDNFQPRSRENCCMLHCWQLCGAAKFDEQIVSSITEHYKTKAEQLQALLMYVMGKITQQGKISRYWSPNICYFLIHHYSICFKSMLLKVIHEAMKQEPYSFIQTTKILPYVYELLRTAELKDQLAPLIRILTLCMNLDNRTKNNENGEIVNKIGAQLDKLFCKKYSSIKLRSRSDGVFFKGKQKIRKLSHNLDNTQTVHEEWKFKEKMIQLKQQKRNKVQNDKQLFDLIVKICFEKVEGADILIHQSYIKIVQPYFKICCFKFKVKIIEMIRTTVLFNIKKSKSPLHSIQNLDRIYRFMLTQFILKELDPEDPEYSPNEHSNYINKNVFYILNHMISLLKSSWNDLYSFVVRLVALLGEAKKDIEIKTERGQYEINLATKLFVRKLILRIIYHTDKKMENLTNIIFLTYLVAFNNENESDPRIFEYFQMLEKYFFIAPFQIKSMEKHEYAGTRNFVDKNMILIGFSCFLCDEQLSATSKKMMHVTRAYLAKQASELSTFRQVFLSRAHFKHINATESSGIKNMMSMFMGGEISEQKFSEHYLYVAEILFLLLSLCIQSCITEENLECLQKSLHLFEMYGKLFIITCTKDGLNKGEHQKRNKKFPKNITYFLIHFLYSVIDSTLVEEVKYQLENSLYRVLQFSCFIVTILSEKIGHPDNINDAYMLSNVMQDVEQYNYFMFQVFQGVLTLPELRLLPTLEKEKVMDIMNHPNMRTHFKNTPKIFIEKQMKQVVEIHRQNISIISKEVKEKLSDENTGVQKVKIEEMICYQEEQFQEDTLQHMRKLNLEYRNSMRIWRKIWKRLRLYHYYWSVAMNQREELNEKWDKFVCLPYKHKLSKFNHLGGLRPILEVKPIEPWHVRKAQLDQQIQYRASNFMLNLYKSQKKNEAKPKSFFSKLFQTEDKTLNSFNVDWLKHNSTRRGYVRLTGQKLIFRYDSTYQKDSHINFTSFTLAEHRPIEKMWPLVQIENICRRRYLAREECLLIQFEDTSSLIFNFIDENCEEFLTGVQKIQTSKSQMMNFLKLNKVSFYTKNFRLDSRQAELEEYTNLWRNQKISNLHYLMLINKLSGRSFLDPVNYPVVPWIISKYDCKQLIYRDLSKTLGYLGSESRRDFYRNKCEVNDPFSDVPIYQYGTHYSSPGVIFNFLVRLSPYTEAARTLQGGRFDLSDRIFSSLKICWHSVTTEVSDVRELIPEFYYLPEFLINIQHYDFGVTQVKERVHNVKLPLWGPNAYQFIVAHRRAFESEQVRTSVHKWIDLIFGYKQKGKLAQENLNLYYYLTYENSINLKEIIDPIERTSIQAQIIHFGQTPSQLFTRPHPEPNKKQPITTIELLKVKFLGVVQAHSHLIIVHGYDDGRLLLYKDSSLLCVECQNIVAVSWQTSISKQPKQTPYHCQDLTNDKRVQTFGNGEYIVIGSYINGDLKIYNSKGNKLYQRAGTVKSVLFINHNENLLLCGCKNGLLEVFEIVYLENNAVLLTLISSEYYMYPITDICEGGGFFNVCAGNLIVVNKISRGLAYVHKKEKMKGCKMVRSLEGKRKVLGSFLVTNPLYCIVYYNLLEVHVSSVNGQFLKSKQIELVAPPIVVTGQAFEQLLVVLQAGMLCFMRMPELQTIQSLPIPHKQYTQVKAVGNRIYLATNNGQILFFYFKKE